MVCLKDFWQYLRTLCAFSIWIGTGILLAVTIIYEYFEEIKKKAKMKKRMAKRKCSALICPISLYEEAVLIYLFDDTHICISCLQNIQKFPIATEIIRLRNRFPFEMWERHRFSDLFPFRGSGFAVYICLVGGVVIFDELWAFTGIDIRVNSIHCPDFGNSEVNLAALLIYSEHMFADILNWWVFQRRWTVGITIYVRKYYAPEK